jgi:osmoprotectant transport system ATP-binding protein
LPIVAGRAIILPSRAKASVAEQSWAVEVLDVQKRFGAVQALAGVTLRLPARECLAVVGESGSGKSTLMRLLNRLVTPDSGAVRVDGRDVLSLDPIELRRRIGYVPQDGGLLPHWRVQRNAELVPRLEERADAGERGRGALALVGLAPADYGTRWPHELSGGQRQRVALARALASDPALLLLDEPFSALDAISRSEVQQVFARVRAAQPVTAVLVTHDLSEALRLADRVAVLRAGRLEQLGSPRDVVHAPATAYVRELIERARSSWPEELR